MVPFMVIDILYQHWWPKISRLDIVQQQQEQQEYSILLLKFHHNHIS